MPCGLADAPVTSFFRSIFNLRYYTILAILCQLFLIISSVILNISYSYLGNRNISVGFLSSKPISVSRYRFAKRGLKQHTYQAADQSIAPGRHAAHSADCQSGRTENLAPWSSCIQSNKNWSVAMGSLRLLHHMSRMLKNQLEDDRKVLSSIATDRKIRQKEEEKKQLHGLKHG